MPWTTLTFGKHRDKSLPQVIFSDPDWFFWALDEGVFEGKGRLENETRLLGRRARQIRIPSVNDEPKEAEYLIHPPTGKFATVEVVPASQPRHEGSSPSFRASVFDLSIPRQIAPYDKLDCANLLKKVKYCLFGDSVYRMTKRRCEDFFDDPSNFGEN